MSGAGPVCAPACPVCGSAALDAWLDAADRPLDVADVGSSRGLVSPGRIVRCRGCRFAFRLVRSTSEELAGVYRRMDTRVYESELAGRDRTARRHLAIVERHARRGRILDVGCASGLFLRRAVRAGWQACGVEPSETLCSRARAALDGRADIRCATLEQADLSAGFDAITLWDVLEHVPDPLAFLAVCRGLLAPQGRLFLNVPDLDSPEARVLGARWPLLLPEHLNYFNRRSLRRCGQRAGLEFVSFGRRRAWFSLEYVALRLAQHRVPGAGLLHKTAAAFPGRLLIPVSLGETYAVWRL